MGTIENDFEKGATGGSLDALQVISQASKYWLDSVDPRATDIHLVLVCQVIDQLGKNFTGTPFTAVRHFVVMEAVFGLPAYQDESRHQFGSTA